MELLRDITLKPDGQSRSLLAPLWHTAFVIALTAAVSIAGVYSAKHAGPAAHNSHLPSYLLSIAAEWILLAFVFWGLRLRRTSIRIVAGPVQPGIKAWGIDVLSAISFWIIALMVLGSLAAFLKPLHLHPENIRSIVTRMAPYSALEVLAWTMLSITAGICEEFVFRGYLQLQCSRISRSSWIGVFASSLVFGLSHGYEGWSGMVLITAFGALFGMLRLVRGNIRAGIVAHAWHDFFSGMILAAIAHHLISSSHA